MCILQVRQGFIYDEDQKAVTKSIRDRIAQVMLNQRNAKREASGEDKKEKEKQDSDEQSIKTEGEDSDKEQQAPESDKEKDDREEIDYSEELESSDAIEVHIQNSFSSAKRIIDRTVQRLEGIAECGSSPHATMDERTVPAFQETTEKVGFEFFYFYTLIISFFRRDFVPLRDKETANN